MSESGASDDAGKSTAVLWGLTSGLPWDHAIQASLHFCCAQPSVTAAVLVTVDTAETLLVTAGRMAGNGTVSLSRSLLDRSFGQVLNRQTILELVSGLGVFSGLTVQLFPWPDLGAVLLLQMASTTAVVDSSANELIQTVARQILGRSTDRSLLFPDVALLEAMAEYAAGAGHEINNPLASIIGQAQLLLKSDTAVERRQALETIGAQAWRVRDMIGNSMLFARPPVPQRSVFPLIPAIQDVFGGLSQAAEENRVALNLLAQDDRVQLRADRSQISNALAQLIRNSIQAIASKSTTGNVEVEVRSDVEGVVEILVRDDGPGLQGETVRRHLFSPFFSGRSAGRGLGFGLSLAWQIVRMHQGLLFHQTPVSGGAEFLIGLGRE